MVEVDGLRIVYTRAPGCTYHIGSFIFSMLLALEKKKHLEMVNRQTVQNKPRCSFKSVSMSPTLSKKDSPLPAPPL